MRCPSCSHPLIILELDDVEIDYCTKCEGIWLDSGELELLLEDSARKDKLLASFRPFSGNKEKKRKCPICSKKMEKVLVDSEKKITLDRCENNCGLWFDKGELMDVIEIGSITEDNKVIRLLQEMFEYKIKK